MTTAVSCPICAVGKNSEWPSTRKPATKMTVIVNMARPTSWNAWRTASSGVPPRSRRARWYLLKKCTVSSTTMPMVMAMTTESANPTSPTTSPQRPNPINPGMKFGARLTSPIRSERKATTSRAEMPMNAITVPRSIARILRCPMCANMSAAPELSNRTMCGALSFSHASARSFSASTSCVESVFAVTVMRVADFATSIRLFRSRPKGSESS